MRSRAHTKGEEKSRREKNEGPQGKEEGDDDDDEEKEEKEEEEEGEKGGDGPGSGGDCDNPGAGSGDDYSYDALCSDGSGNVPPEVDSSDFHSFKYPGIRCNGPPMSEKRH